MGSVFEFVAELFRRKVVKVLCAYIAVVWLLANGFASLFPPLGVSDWWLRAFIVVAVIALPLVIFLTWKYDVVPPHLVRDPKDADDPNPILGWARRRHDAQGAGTVILRWHPSQETTREQPFFEPVSIGRDASNDIELRDQRVSRHHAVLWAENGAWRVRDCDSMNGTFVDSERVTGTAQLPPSCELRLHPDGPALQLHIDQQQETVVTL
jgi:FHA domain